MRPPRGLLLPVAGLDHPLAPRHAAEDLVAVPEGRRPDAPDRARGRAGAEGRRLERVARLVDNAEYKRRQGPTGIRVTPKAFGKDRRMPITNRYRG